MQYDYFETFKRAFSMVGNIEILMLEINEYKYGISLSF
jgi:hypothetical protein